MAGIVQNRSTVVKFIQSLFSSDTDVLLVLKELLQNADDSPGATFAAVGVSNGLPESSHPLLRGPALYAVNDGKFSQKDAATIITMGLSSKGDDSNTVGKFGLGLKSAFSLAEAIFFMDSRLSPELDYWNPGHYDIFSPWLGGLKSHAPEWEPFSSQQRQEVLEYVHMQGLPAGFVVWIPLRQMRHCQVLGESRLRAITRQFPGDSEIKLDPEVLRTAAELLPLMSRVKQIRLKMQPEETLPWTILSLSGSGRTVDLKQPQAFERQLSGVVGTNDSTTDSVFAGWEIKLDVQDIADLAKSEFWPSAETVDDYGDAVTKSDPAVPHGAALWQRTPAQGKAVFRGHWSVFLPVESFGPPVGIEGAQNFTLTLHGYFFLDTKRKTIYRWDGGTPAIPRSEEDLRAAWNARLARETTLPWVLSGLKDITVGESEAVVESLTSALEQWVKQQGLRRDITSRHQWARILVKGAFQWCLLPARQLTLPVPSGVDLQGILPRTVEGFVLRDVRSPKLLRQPEALEWPLSQAAQVIDRIDFTQLLTQPESLQALTALAVYLPRHELQFHLIPKLRDALQAVQPTLLVRRKSEIARLLGNLLPHSVVFLPVEGLSPEASQRLMALPLSVLLVPNGYSTTNMSRVLKRQDGQRLLDAVQEPDEIAPILRLVRDNLEDQDLYAELVEGRALLPTLQGAKGVGPWLSVGKVRELIEQGRVFRQQGDDQAMLEHLQEVLGDTPLYVIQGRLLDLLDLDGVPTLSLSSILNSVGQAQSLGTLEARLGLLRKLTERWRSLTDSLEHRATLRLLLHGQVSRRADISSPLLLGSDRKNIWWRVAQLAREHLSEGWRVIAEPVDFLNDRDLKRLVAERADPRSLAPLLSSGPHLFPGKKLSAQDRETVILEFDDTTVLKQLPIFTATDGELVAAGDGVHLEGGFDADEALQGRITLLTRPDDKKLATRLRELAPPLSALGAWNYLRHQPELWHHWKTIVRIVQAAGGAKPTQADELHWWPRADHGGARPRDVLLFPELPDTLAALEQLRDAGNTDIMIGHDLHPEFIHDFLPALNYLLPKESEREAMLLELLGSARTYFVGSSGTVPPPVWLRAFDGASFAELPLLGLLQAFSQNRELQTKLLKAAARPVKPEQVLRMLDFLYGQVVRGDESTRNAALQIYPLLLEDLRTSRVPAEQLAPLHLLNAQGEWRKAAELTRSGTQFEPQYVLAHGHAQALYGSAGESPAELLSYTSQPASPDTQNRLQRSTQDLLQYLKNWATVVPQEQRGAFLALLDGNPELHQAAQPYLMNYPFQVLREEAFKGVPSDRLPTGFDTYLSMIDRIRLQVSLSLGETVTVENLLGDPLTVPYRQDKELTSIFSATHGERPYWDGENFIYPVALKVISLHDREVDYPALLWQSLQWALHHCVNLLPPGLHAAYSRVEDSSQTTVTATQRRLIQAAAQTWGRQLGVDKQSQVSQKLKAIDREDRQAVQARERGAVEAAKVAEEHVRMYQNDLKALIEEDHVTQMALLQSVRNKIEDMQYVPASVPFELLQNADDALTEWQQLTGEQQEERTTFTADLSEGMLTFTHYGRPINYYGDSSGQARGFDADLEKMLTLLSSDKDEQVTGKFGLGFKSTFLLSDRPTVLSGRLAFDVLGGVYPVLPPQERLDELRAYQQKNDPQEIQDGTLIALPLREAPVAQQVMKHFEQLAPYVLGFTRSLRRIRIRNGEVTRLLAWQETPVVAGVALVNSTLGQQRFTAIMLSGPDFKLLLPYTARGFASLPEEVPNLWVTAPTAERLKLPFILNAAFPLDPGRAQLARNEALLDQLVECLRPELQQAFVSLLQQAHKKAFLEQLGWHASLPATFLNSLWKHLAEPLARESDSAALPLLRKLLWGTSGAIGSLTFKQSLIPTGLPGLYGAHVIAGTPKLRVLGFENEIFKHLMQQSEFQQLYPPGTLISRETANTIEKLQLPVPEGRLSLVEVLRGVLSDRQVTPKRSEWLAAVLSEDVVKALIDDEQDEQWLDSLKFRAGDGQYRPAAYLLMPLTKGTPEESARAAFAPHEAVISDEYSLPGLVLARRIRQDIPKRQTVAWILQAQGETRLAALRFMLDYLKPSDADAKALQQQLRGSWLEYQQLTNLPTWTALTGEQRIDLLNLLRQLPGISTSSPLLQGPLLAPTDDEALEEEEFFDDTLPGDALERIHRWWGKEHGVLTARFNAWVYPDGQPFVISKAYESHNPAHRQAWLSLLMLGSLQSMGRTRPEQHKGFLRHCQEQGWLTEFSSLNASDQVWMDSVRGYLGQQPDLLKYYAWMRGFVGFYQMGKWLDEYVELFRQLDRLPETSLRSLLAPNTNPALQGSGLSAPPLTRTLGIGAPFVIRELLRAGVLKPDRLRPLAYMPTRRLKDLIGQLTRQDIHGSEPEEGSRQIAAALARQLGEQQATFHGTYDLPFQILLGSGWDDQEACRLQVEVLGRPLYRRSI